jgi:DNA-binding LacI/PurR family transcriptional regulator
MPALCNNDQAMKDSELAPLRSRPPITARELAERLGVSQSAVSRAFTPGASASPAMRARILAAADQFGYSPNAIASILSKRKSNIVGLLVSDFQNPTYPIMIDKLSHGLQRAGQQCLLFNISSGIDIKRQLAAIQQYSIDAVIVLASAAILSVPALLQATAGRTAILINRIARGSGFASVCYDNAAGSRAIADHFYAIGHRRVAFVGGTSGSHTNRERQEAFVAHVRELGMTFTGNVSAGAFSYEAGYGAASGIAALKRTHAVLFSTAILAAGGMDGLREQVGLLVPQDLATAGFQEVDMTFWQRYALTAFCYSIDATAERVVRLLSGRPAVPMTQQHVHRIAGELVIRSSTQPPG